MNIGSRVSLANIPKPYEWKGTVIETRIADGWIECHVAFDRGVFAWLQIETLVKYDAR